MLRSYTRILLIVLILLYKSLVQLQANDSTKVFLFNGDVSITNNGFSFVPTFNLGKPAAAFNLYTGTTRFTFEPQFQFDLDGMRPWSFVGFWR